MPKKIAKKSVKKAAPKKAAPKKAATKKAATKKVATKKAAAKTARSTATKDAVGFRLRMSADVHKQLKSQSKKEGVSQNKYINKLIQDAK